MQRIDSTHSTWIFDTQRMRFRRVPKGADPATPSLESDWQPYFALDVDPGTGAFTVALNEDRTRLLRAWRTDDVHPEAVAGGIDENGEPRTRDLRLQPSGEGHADR